MAAGLADCSPQGSLAALGRGRAPDAWCPMLCQRLVAEARQLAARRKVSVLVVSVAFCELTTWACAALPGNTAEATMLLPMI